LKILARQNRYWGDAFSRDYTDSRLGLDGSFSWQFTGGIALDAQTDLLYDQHYGFRSGFGTELSKVFSVGTMAVFTHNSYRLPNAFERRFFYSDYQGNSGLKVETIQGSGISFTSFPGQSLRYSTGISFGSLDHEINPSGNSPMYDQSVTDTELPYEQERPFSYENGRQRNWTTVSLSLQKNLLTSLIFSGSGRYSFTDHPVGPAAFGWAGLSYRGRWFKHKMDVILSTGYQFYSTQSRLRYEPVMERFYVLDDQPNTFGFPFFKGIAEIKTARFFFEISNPLAGEFELIQGYPEQFRRVRAGVEWLLTD